jgi:hypothetical protein
MNCSTTWSYAKQILVYIAIFVLAYWLNPTQALHSEERLFGAYMLTGVYGGWVFINKYFPGFLLILTVKAWLIYFAIKFIAAAMIGFFVTPFVVVYNIIQIIRELRK